MTATCVTDNPPANGKPEPEKGIACRSCGCRMFYVLETRQAYGGRIMRRRECRHCQKRITTYEKQAGS